MREIVDMVEALGFREGRGRRGVVSGDRVRMSGGKKVVISFETVDDS
jgi:hypothetical protein